MSGIAGILSPDAVADRPRLERIHGALAHRRGDTESLQATGPLGLSYRGWATPFSAPPCSWDSCWIVADACLYNRREVTPQLPGEPANVSDAELIARAYAHWGADCLRHLEGDFAFALWDARQQQLFCARDPLGVRPFFYRWDGKSFVWASEVKALLADPDYTPAPDEAMLGEYVLGWSNLPDTSATFYRGIRQLPGGHCLTLESGRLEVRRYWDIEPAEEARYRRSFQDNVEEFRALFERAVARRLEAADPLGLLVSGGLDSTSVGSMVERLMQAARPSRPSRYYVSFFYPEPRGDERVYARAFAEMYGCQMNYLAVNGFRVLEGVESFAELEEGPSYDTIWSFTQQWAAHLQEHGCRVALTGFGGDNIFPEAGPGYLADVGRRAGWRAAWQALSRASAYYRMPRRFFSGPTLRFLLPGSAKRIAKRWLGKEVADWVQPAFARRSGLLERVRQPPPVRGFSSASQELTYRHLTSGKFARQLGYADRIAGAHGVELRHPFLDPPLVSFTLLAPLEQKIVDGEMKILLRRAMQGILPEEVRQRPDKGTPGPFLADWIRRYEAERWRKEAEKLRLCEEYVKPAQVKALVRRFLGGDDDALKPAWELLCLELWLRRKFAGNSG